MPAAFPCLPIGQAGSAPALIASADVGLVIAVRLDAPKKPGRLNRRQGTATLAIWHRVGSEVCLRC
jgi:hypothetical protein